MNVRYRTIALSLALSLAPAAALAQQVIDAPARAAAAPPAPESNALAPPELPEPPAALAPRVAALTRIAEQTVECYAGPFERVEHQPDPRCGRWYAALLRGGDATAYAIGEVLNRPGSERAVRDNMGDWQRGPRLVQVLVATRSPMAAPFLLRYVADEALVDDEREGFDETAQEALRQLSRLAGRNVSPAAPWESVAYATVEARRAAAQRWLRWWRSLQDASPAERIAVGAERVVADLTDADVAVRFAAMQRLVSVPAHRAAVAEAARSLLADVNLPARAVTHVTRWARRNRLPLVAR